MSLVDFIIAVAKIAWPITLLGLLGLTIILYENINIIAKEYKVNRLVLVAVILIWLLIAFLAGYAWCQVFQPSGVQGHPVSFNS